MEIVHGVWRGGGFGIRPNCYPVTAVLIDICGNLNTDSVKAFAGQNKVSGGFNKMLRTPVIAVQFPGEKIVMATEAWIKSELERRNRTTLSRFHSISDGAADQIHADYTSAFSGTQTLRFDPRQDFCLRPMRMRATRVEGERYKAVKFSGRHHLLKFTTDDIVKFAKESDCMRGRPGQKRIFIQVGNNPVEVVTDLDAYIDKVATKAR